MKKQPLITIHVNSPHLKAVVANFASAFTRKVDAVAGKVKVHASDACRAVNDRIDEMTSAVPEASESPEKATSRVSDSVKKEA